MAEYPLVVDLDGTLLRSDLLIETGLLFLRDRPHRFLDPLRWLLRGKAALKHELAYATDVDVSVLPYDEAVIEFIRAERGRGRRVVLATASHRRLAERVAEHLALFDEVISTEGDRNLSAGTKRDVLVKAFGEKGFDYLGNSADDLPVWSAARSGFIANASRSIERRARRLGNLSGVVSRAQSSWRDWAKALRLHHWLKNVLLFVPLLASHLYSVPALVAESLLAFVCFGLCASSVYILNDLLDVADDRHHLRKRYRPYASGRLTLRSGYLAVPVLLLAAFGLAAWQLPWLFVAGLGAYYLLTLAYSLWLKRRMVIDVMGLAALYTLRIILGGWAIGIGLSFWLLAFSMFLFLSLAMVKRYAELYDRQVQGNGEIVRGRGYLAGDLAMIASLGGAAGYLSVLVLALYINDPDTAQMYRRPEFIWLACPLLLTWISRVWMIAHRGGMHEDPVIFAIRDRASLLIVAATAAVFWAAR